MTTLENVVARHYGDEDLLKRILTGLEAARIYLTPEYIAIARALTDLTLVLKPDHAAAGLRRSGRRQPVNGYRIPVCGLHLRTPRPGGTDRLAATRKSDQQEKRRPGL